MLTGLRYSDHLLYINFNKLKTDNLQQLSSLHFSPLRYLVSLPRDGVKVLRNTDGKIQSTESLSSFMISVVHRGHLASNKADFNLVPYIKGDRQTDRQTD